LSGTRNNEQHLAKPAIEHFGSWVDSARPKCQGAHCQAEL